MATAAVELPLSDATDIAVVVAHNPAIVLLDAGKRDDLFAHIRREVEAFEPVYPHYHRYGEDRDEDAYTNHYRAMARHRQAMGR